MDAISVLGFYIAVKTTTVIGEEIFSSHNNKQASLCWKIHDIYHRYMNQNVHFLLYSFWSNLPIGFTAFLLDEEDILYRLGLLLITEEVHSNIPERCDSKILNFLHLINYVIIIAILRTQGIFLCNYLQQRTSAPLNRILERLRNSLEFQPVFQRRR
jgi:hypothetical protein